MILFKSKNFMVFSFQTQENHILCTQTLWFCTLKGVLVKFVYLLTDYQLSCLYKFASRFGLREGGGVLFWVIVHMETYWLTDKEVKPKDETLCNSFYLPVPLL